MGNNRKHHNPPTHFAPPMSKPQSRHIPIKSYLLNPVFPSHSPVPISHPRYARVPYRGLKDAHERVSQVALCESSPFEIWCVWWVSRRGSNSRNAVETPFRFRIQQNICAFYSEIMVGLVEEDNLSWGYKRQQVREMCKTTTTQVRSS